MFRILFVLLLFAFYTTSFAQEEPSFGGFTEIEKKMQVCSFDPEAEAVILLDLATAYPIGHKLVIDRRIRLKILKESGIERGNIRIPYYSKDDFQTLSDIEGLVQSGGESNSSVRVSKLEKSGIFHQNINERWSELRLAMPDVKVGSIIEYRYTSTMLSWWGLDKWEFQTDIPTEVSKFDLTISRTIEFAYTVFHRPDLPIKVTPYKSDGRIVFEMRNIAALRSEPITDAPSEYQQRVVFQVSKFNAGGYNQKYADSWAQLAKDLLNQNNFGRVIEKSVPGSDEFLQKVKLLGSDFEKMNTIYSFVRNNFASDGYRSIYASDGLKKVWEKRSGNTGERNLLLLNLLKEAKLDATPLLVCERSEGKVNKAYPFLDQFSRVVSLVKIDNDKYILDATDKFTPPSMIPFSLANTYAFAVVWKNATEPFLLDSKGKTKRTQSNVLINIGEDGNITGTVATRSLGYDRIARLQYLKESDTKKFTERFLLVSETDLEIDSLEIEGIDNDSLPLLQSYKYNVSTNQSGEYRIVNLNLFFDLRKSPFVSDIRFTNINFGTTMSKSVTQLIQLAPNMIPDGIPKNISLVMPDKSIVLNRTLVFDKEKNLVISRIDLDINKPVFTPYEYPAVKDFYKKMVDYLNEPLVLKNKK